ncbi:MAG TPA: chaperone modulator CbpM [Solirubrobacteraceae bacterium]|jgi:hypothetical protein|nr:chaperone modulator CbpM [Solirubrobacteraceae bacterium]
MSARRTRPRPADEAAVEQAIELTVVARQAGVRIALARRYLAFGLFEAFAVRSETPLFDPICASRLAKAERLRRDLSLNYAGAVLVCELLDRIEALEDRFVDSNQSD